MEIDEPARADTMFWIASMTKAVVSVAALQLIVHRSPAGAPLPADGTHSAVPELSNDVPALPFKQGFGLGVSLLLEDIPGMRRAGTGDWAGLCNSYFWIDHASGIAATLMTQILPFFDAGVVQTLLGFEASVAASLPAAVHAQRPHDQRTLPARNPW